MAAPAEAAYTRYTLRLFSGYEGAPAAAAGPGGAAVEEAYLKVHALLGELAVGGWQENDDGSEVVFWLPAQEAAPAALTQLRACGSLTASPEAPGWRDQWRRFHQPVVVGELYVRPPWHPPRPGCLDLVVDVGLAFGTGAHVTTRECLQALCALPRGSLLDLGTGSGVLALAALRLGFAPVYALDNDPAAIAAAKENAVTNGLDPILLLADLTNPDLSLPETEAVIANLTLSPILALAGRCAAPVSGQLVGRIWRPQHLVLAGLLTTQVDEAIAAFSPAFAAQERLLLGDWALVHLVMST
ncbi:MAG: 50S ribosomal protein L11 methyltransferase [Thermoleophilia bacterium]